MKYLLTLILVCTLLCGCSQAPMLTTSISLRAAQIPPEANLPGDVIGTPIPSGDGRKLFYSTGTELRVWDGEVHRRIRELSGRQLLTGVLLGGAVVQCENAGSAYFYSASDGQLLKTFPGHIRVETGTDGYTALIPVGSLEIRVFGEYNEPPRMMLSGVEEAYYPAEAPDAAGLEKCRTDAGALEDAYGIRILLWNAVPEGAADIGEHLVPVIRRELAVLEQRLSVFPEDMIRQAAGHFSGLNFCPVRKKSEGLPCGAFRDGKMLYLLSESGGSGKDFYHALFHALETAIFSKSHALDRWNELNPAGFLYDEDYDANRLRDSGIYLTGENRAFANRFSMSFPREDRAEVFALATMPENEGLFASSVMQAKLSALCSGIREAYGLEDYGGALLWEQYLKEKNTHVP